MRIPLLIFLLVSQHTLGQNKPKQFGSDILTYNMIGHSINKYPNLFIVDSKGVNIEDRDSCFHILRQGYVEHYVVNAYLVNGETVNAQQFNYRFISLPDPKIRWTALDQFRLSGKPNDKHPIIGLHKDSLAYFKSFEVHHFVPHLPELKWEVVKGTLYTQGITSAPPTFEGGNSLPDAFIDSLKIIEDTIGVSLNATIRGEDGISRQIGTSVLLVKLEGLQYELHRDPLYFYKNYSDTLQVSKKQLYSSDTLVLHNPVRLYLKLPRLKKDYFFKWDDGTSYCYDVPYTKVEAGKGYIVVDKYNSEGDYELQITYEKNPYLVDEKTGLMIDHHFIKKNFFFTYAKP